MNFTVPDKLFKFLVLVGVLLLGFTYFQEDKIDKEYYTKIDSVNNLSDSLDIEILKSKNYVSRFFKNAKSLSLKYDVPNILYYDKDSSLIFNQALNGPKNIMIVSDSIKKYWTNYGKMKDNLSLLERKSELLNKRLDSEKKFKNSLILSLEPLKIIGAVSLILGLLFWISSEIPIGEYSNEKHYLKKLEDRSYVHCQSCGNKFTSMRKYGKDENGSTNYAFCRECYNEGQFVNDDLTMEEVIENAKEKYKKDWLTRKLEIRHIKTLERWKK